MIPVEETLRKLLREAPFLQRLGLQPAPLPTTSSDVKETEVGAAEGVPGGLADSANQFVQAQSLEQIPPFLRLLNGAEGPLASAAPFASLVLALETAEKKCVLLLNGDVAQYSNAYRSLRGLLRHADYAIEGLYVAPQSLFNQFFQQAQNKSLGSLPAAADLSTASDQPLGTTESAVSPAATPAARLSASALPASGKVTTARQSNLVMSNSAPSVATFYQMIQKGIALGASDVHVCIRETGAKILMRIFGQIEQIMTLSREDALEAMGVAYNKLAAENSRSRTAHQFNPRDKQYCTIEVTFAKQRWRIRYQSTNVEGGLDVVLRLLPSDLIAESKPLSDLGYSPSQCEELRLGLMRSVGAIFMAGGTGSGKSTTLKTLITMDPKRANFKWYSVEDPVEYRITKVSQIPVQRDTSEEDSMPFVEAFRALMRMDPDSILIGEIRDKETADLFSAAVMSGHRCLTTVHASSAIAIAGRLCSEPILMPRPVLAAKGFISLLVYQSLLPELCPHCRQPAAQVCEPHYLAYVARKFQVDVSGVNVSSGKSCGQSGCRNGITGRTVAAEIIALTSEMRALLQEGKDLEVERRWRKTRTVGFDHEDMTGKTAFEHGLYKCLQGRVDPHDLESAFEAFQTYELMDP
jgi:type II secretory ATPase GspE/PulE/Tfp pilus assembly ATPase PilB-like protein